MKFVNAFKAIVILIIWTIVTIGPGVYFLNGKKQELEETIIKGPSYSLMAAAFFILMVVILTRNQKVTGLVFSNFKNVKIIGFQLIIILIGLVFLSFHFNSLNFTVLKWAFFNSILVGISEELMFRGLLLSAFTKEWGFKKAAIAVILIFGAIHILNAISTGKLLAGFMQAFMAMSTGILFLAYRVKNGTIIIAMILHAIWDFMVFILSNTTKTLKPDILTLVVEVILLLSPIAFGIYGLYLLNKKGVADDYIESQDL